MNVQKQAGVACGHLLPNGEKCLWVKGDGHDHDTDGHVAFSDSKSAVATLEVKGAGHYLRLVADRARFGSADREIILGAAGALEAKDEVIKTLRSGCIDAIHKFQKTGDTVGGIDLLKLIVKATEDA